MLKAFGKPKRLGAKMGKVVHLSDESSSGLNRMLRSPIASGQQRGPQMCHAIKAFYNTSGEEFPAPNGAVVPETGAVTTYPNDALIPCRTLREHGCDVSAMML